MKRVAVIALIILGVGGGWSIQAFAAEEKASAAAAAPMVPAPEKFDQMGAKLPPAFMKTVSGDKAIELDKMGKPSLIMFVNSSCSACRAELYAFTKLAEKYKDKLNTLVVTVDFDPQNTTKRFPDLANMPYTLLDGSDFKVASALGFNFTPATVVADASGKQVYRKGGFSTGDDAAIVQEVMKLVK